MASGRLGVAQIAANTDTVVYTVPAGKLASCNVAIVNRGADVALVNVAFSTTSNPALSEYVEYQVHIPANGILERTAIVASAGERVIVRASTENCTARVHGYEEDA